jgi:hypothetical protein
LLTVPDINGVAGKLHWEWTPMQLDVTESRVGGESSFYSFHTITWWDLMKKSVLY